MRSAAVAAKDRSVSLVSLWSIGIPVTLPRRGTLACMLNRPTTWSSDKNLDAIPTQIGRGEADQRLNGMTKSIENQSLRALPVGSRAADGKTGARGGMDDYPIALAPLSQKGGVGQGKRHKVR
jgi:hypothetical protein